MIIFYRVKNYKMKKPGAINKIRITFKIIILDYQLKISHIILKLEVSIMEGWVSHRYKQKRKNRLSNLVSINLCNFGSKTNFEFYLMLAAASSIVVCKG